MRDCPRWERARARASPPPSLCSFRRSRRIDSAVHDILCGRDLLEGSILSSRTKMISYRAAGHQRAAQHRQDEAERLAEPLQLRPRKARLDRAEEDAGPAAAAAANAAWREARKS